MPYRSLGPVLDPSEAGENGHSTAMVNGSELTLFYQSRAAATNHRWRYGIATALVRLLTEAAPQILSADQPAGRGRGIDRLALRRSPLPFELYTSTFVTLLVVVDPIGLTPIFVSLTRDMDAATRRHTGFLAAAIASGVLIAAALGGEWLLNALGISIPAFRIAGGLLLFWIAAQMVYGIRLEGKARNAGAGLHEEAGNIAAFPIGIPLMAGPGAITAVLLIAAQARSNPLLLGWLILMVLVVMGLCVLCFLAAQRIADALGITGTVVLARLLGIILAALAIQYVADGIRALI